MISFFGKTICWQIGCGSSDGKRKTKCERIAAHREELALKQYQFAEQIGVTKTAMSKYENNVNISIDASLIQQLNPNNLLRLSERAEILFEQQNKTAEQCTAVLSQFIYRGLGMLSTVNQAISKHAGKYMTADLSLRHNFTIFRQRFGTPSADFTALQAGLLMFNA